MPKGQKTDPALVAQWRELRKQGYSTTDIALMTNQHSDHIDRTIWYNVKDIPYQRGQKPTTVAVVAQDLSDEAIQKGSLKERVLLTLARGAAPTMQDLYDRIKRVTPVGENVDMHNMAHVTKSLYRAGLVAMRESNGDKGNKEVWRNVRLTQRGEMKAFELRPRDAKGPDPTDFRTQPKQAPAGPVEVVKPVEPPKENGQVHVVLPPLTPAQEKLATALHEDRMEQERLDAAFPLIKILLGRELKHRTAVRLLREAGMTEQADLIEGDAPKNTPLEEEVLRLLKEFKIHLEG